MDGDRASSGPSASVKRRDISPPRVMVPNWFQKLTSRPRSPPKKSSAELALELSHQQNEALRKRIEALQSELQEAREAAVAATANSMEATSASNLVERYNEITSLGKIIGTKAPESGMPSVATDATGAPAGAQPMVAPTAGDEEDEYDPFTFFDDLGDADLSAAGSAYVDVIEAYPTAETTMIGRYAVYAEELKLVDIEQMAADKEQVPNSLPAHSPR